MTAHEDWIQHAIVGVQAVQATFTRPDDDWHHMLLGQDADGRLVMVDIREAFVDAPTKEAFAAVGLPRLIVASRLHRVAFVASAWVARLEGEERVQAERGECIRASRHPRRQEVVMVYACSDGTESMSTARIRRESERPPRLSEWTQATTQDQTRTGFDGLFAEAIRPAVAEVRRRQGGPRWGDDTPPRGREKACQWEAAQWASLSSGSGPNPRSSSVTPSWRASLRRIRRRGVASPRSQVPTVAGWTPSSSPSCAWLRCRDWRHCRSWFMTKSSISRQVVSGQTDTVFAKLHGIKKPPRCYQQPGARPVPDRRH